MGLPKKGKGALALLLGGPPPAEDEGDMAEDSLESDTEEAPAEDEGDGGEDAALADAFEAVKADDVEGFKAAMRSAIESCMSKSYDEE